MSEPTTLNEKILDVLDATHGTGPLVERDYSAVIEGTALTPEDVCANLRVHFGEFAPRETADFSDAKRGGRPLEVGDELSIRIALQGQCKVRVIHVDARSVTLRTLKGHPEAGRITFGAGRDDSGRLTFRILSRARSSSLVNYLGYFLMGKQMQARCWIGFIDRVAAACGGRVVGRIRVETRRKALDASDQRGCDAPTFTCSQEI